MQIIVIPEIQESSFFNDRIITGNLIENKKENTSDSEVIHDSINKGDFNFLEKPDFCNLGKEIFLKI